MHTKTGLYQGANTNCFLKQLYLASFCNSRNRICYLMEEIVPLPLTCISRQINLSKTTHLLHKVQWNKINLWKKTSFSNFLWPRLLDIIANTETKVKPGTRCSCRKMKTFSIHTRVVLKLRRQMALFSNRRQI